MLLPIICGLGSLLGFVFLWVVLGYDEIDRSFCPTTHQIGPITLTHYAAIECAQALEVARVAWEIWEHPKLQLELSDRLSEGFELEVIFDPRKGPGWRPWGTSKAVINLAHRGEESELKLPTIIAEELYHVCRFGIYGDEEYIFRPESGNDHLGKVLYYALNPFETEALRFVVEVTGVDTDLLAEVEECLERQAGSLSVED